MVFLKIIDSSSYQLNRLKKKSETQTSIIMRCFNISKANWLVTRHRLVKTQELIHKVVIEGFFTGNKASTIAD